MGLRVYSELSEQSYASTGGTITDCCAEVAFNGSVVNGDQCLNDLSHDVPWPGVPHILPLQLHFGAWWKNPRTWQQSTALWHAKVMRSTLCRNSPSHKRCARGGISVPSPIPTRAACTACQVQRCGAVDSGATPARANAGILVEGQPALCPSPSQKNHCFQG
eukprot:6469735-Amphidinium_carterae.1